MAASLGVEWAKQGVRVNALRSVASCLTLFAADNLNKKNSPGYMLTKLTRDILAKESNAGLKVVFSQNFLSSWSFLILVSQETWERLTPMGRVSFLGFPSASVLINDSFQLDGWTRGSFSKYFFHSSMKVLNFHRVQLCSWQATHQNSWLGLRYVLMVDTALYNC